MQDPPEYVQGIPRVLKDGSVVSGVKPRTAVEIVEGAPGPDGVAISAIGASISI